MPDPGRFPGDGWPHAAHFEWVPGDGKPFDAMGAARRLLAATVDFLKSNPI